MATTTINDKSIQCILLLEKLIEFADLTLLQKRSKLVQRKPTQCNVHTSTTDLANNYSDLTLSTDILAAILQKIPTILTNTLRLKLLL